MHSTYGYGFAKNKLIFCLEFLSLFTILFFKNAKIGLSIISVNVYIWQILENE